MIKPFVALASSFAMLAFPALVQAQQLPPLIRMVVQFAPGASTDVTARAIAQQLGPRLGVNVIVENKAGAAGMIGAAAVARGPKDGSQLLFTSISMISAAATTRNAPIDVVNDLVPAAIVYEAPQILVVPASSSIKTVQDFVAAARARPNHIKLGTGGVGTIAHLTGELLNTSAGIQTMHVPYKGASLALTDLISGTLDGMFAFHTTFAGNIENGRLRAIGVTSEKPSPAFPAVPAINTVVSGFSGTAWTAVFVAAETPAPIVARLNREINEISRSKELARMMASDGATPLALTPPQAATWVRDSYSTWKHLATSKNIVLD